MLKFEGISKKENLKPSLKINVMANGTINRSPVDMLEKREAPPQRERLVRQMSCGVGVKSCWAAGRRRLADRPTRLGRAPQVGVLEAGGQRGADGGVAALGEVDGHLVGGGHLGLQQLVADERRAAADDALHVVAHEHLARHHVVQVADDALAERAEDGAQAHVARVQVADDGAQVGRVPLAQQRGADRRQPGLRVLGHRQPQRHRLLPQRRCSSTPGTT